MTRLDTVGDGQAAQSRGLPSPRRTKRPLTSPLNLGAEALNLNFNSESVKHLIAHLETLQRRTGLYFPNTLHL